MEQLTKIFPADDFALLGVILALPLLGALGNGLFGKRLGKQAVTLIALSALGLAFVAAVTQFCLLSSAQSALNPVVEHGHEAAEHVVGQAARFKWIAWQWLEMGGVGQGLSFRTLSLDVAFSVDALNGTMCLIITGIGFLIHLYSSKYMEEDPGYYRFFAYLNLFIFSMLVLVLGDSLPILFVGWEGVGLCSYLLIGFWFKEDANAAAGKKAFITNRIGDFGLLVAMGLLAYYVGALDWAGIGAGQHNLLQPVKIWPVGSDVPVASLLPDAWAAEVNAPRYVNAATLVGLALFLGCAGKSAQIPLYVWLPDAMAGPTPVSALIHAATMVTAGVYLVCRMSGVFLLSPMAMFVVALIGALTALFAATIAFVQNDIKKVLAYSTVSQLGFMFLGVGVGAFVAGFFHVMTHAFFKACMFLGAGSVIHAMHARIHGTEASQDMRNMGGMRKFMPVTFGTFAVAWAAIVGFPLTSGFFSKDEILLKAKTSLVTGPAEILSPSGRIAVDNFVWEPWM
ncbi:MAG TPA: NADH-quinone oxidoreductase subunit L, partial [Polyangiaceae bacterium]|nr:NADH-quinone oxidoreductase subunit L [Polyangiaceae bacterium]